MSKNKLLVLIMLIATLILSQSVRASGDPGIVFLSGSIFSYQLIMFMFFLKKLRKNNFQKHAIGIIGYLIFGMFAWNQYFSSYSNESFFTIVLIGYPILFLIYAFFSVKR